MTLLQFARSPLGRVLFAVTGLTTIALLVRHVDATTVWQALVRARVYLPAVLAIEASLFACELAALRELYGKDRRRLPTGDLVRAGLIGYAVMGIAPAGRAVAEAAKAALLARHSSAARAAAAAARFQGIALLANAMISVPCVVAAILLGAPLLMAGLIAGNAFITLGLGLGILLAGRRSHIGRWLARRTARAHQFGPALDEVLHQEPAFPRRAMVWAILARVCQVGEYMVLVAAVGGELTVLNGLFGQGVHLVGAALGDLIPGQLGATEANFTFAARPLSLTPGDAMAIALLAHIAQIIWVAIGALVPLLWPAETRVRPSTQEVG